MIFTSAVQYKKAYNHIHGIFTDFKSQYGIEKVILLNHLFGIDTIYKAVIVSRSKSINPRLLCSELYSNLNFTKANPKGLEWNSNILSHVLQIFIAWYAGFKVTEANIGYYNGKPILLLHKLKYGLSSRTIYGVDHQMYYRIFESSIKQLKLALSESLDTSIVDLQEKLSYNPYIYIELSKLRESSLMEMTTIVTFISHYIKSLKKLKFKVGNVFQSSYEDLNISDVEFEIKNISDIQTLLKKNPKHIYLTKKGLNKTILFRAKCYLTLWDLCHGIFKGTWIYFSIYINAMFVWETEIYKIDV